MRFAYGITTIGHGHFLDTTLSHIPADSRVFVVDNKATGWSLARAWNHIMDVLLWNEAYDACLIMNDDVVLRPDTGPILAWGILTGQYLKPEETQLSSIDENLRGWPNPFGGWQSHWPEDRPELLLLSARHAHWSDACTDVPDWEMLQNAKPIWQPGPDFSCFCVSRRFGQEVGRFDEEFYPAYFEDNDAHRRIQLAGFEAGALAPYWHFRNGTLRTDDQQRAIIQANFENCKRRYCAKWGAPYDNSNPISRETFTTPFGR